MILLITKRAQPNSDRVHAGLAYSPRDKEEGGRMRREVGRKVSLLVASQRFELQQETKTRSKPKNRLWWTVPEL